MGAGLTQGFTVGIAALSPSDGYGETQPDGNSVQHPEDDFCFRVILKTSKNREFEHNTTLA